MKNKTKNFLNLCTSILIVTIWNYFPYKSACFNCDGNSDFWWNLPIHQLDYQGINWDSFFFINFIFTILAIFFSQSIIIISSNFDHFRIENIRLFVHNQLFIDENKDT